MEIISPPSKPENPKKNRAQIVLGSICCIVVVTHTRQLVSYGTRSIEMANGRIVNSKA